LAGQAERKAFRAAVEAIRSRFPHLDAALGESRPNVDAFFELPSQDGLRFPISVNLQGDELHLNAGAFWCSWFPCTDSERANAFVEAVCGLISGEYRIVEYRRGGLEQKALKALLQRPEGVDWATVATYSTLHLPLYFGARRTFLRNAD
jgi:hypothetical protein